MQGDNAKARTAYQDFLAAWKAADPDIPVLIAAKSEYTNLKYFPPITWAQCSGRRRIDRIQNKETIRNRDFVAGELLQQAGSIAARDRAHRGHRFDPGHVHVHDASLFALLS